VLAPELHATAPSPAQRLPETLLRWRFPAPEETGRLLHHRLDTPHPIPMPLPRNILANLILVRHRTPLPLPSPVSAFPYSRFA
jgi:hypothetical protein